MKAQEINQSLEIRSVKGLKFGNKKAYCKPTGFALYHKKLGFLSFKESNQGNPYKTPRPYNPLGGKKALKSILDSGGFDNYEDIEWIQPM